MVKKIVTTVGQYKDYIGEIQQNYELVFTPYRLHTRPDGTFVTPPPPPFVFIVGGICIGRCYHDAGYHSTDCNGW